MSLEIREWLIKANHYPRYYATVPIFVLLRDVFCKKRAKSLHKTFGGNFAKIKSYHIKLVLETKLGV